MSNKEYPQEFRNSTVKLALNSEKSVSQIGIDLPITMIQLKQKKRIYANKSSAYGCVPNKLLYCEY